jgi:hypothetical protein
VEELTLITGNSTGKKIGEGVLKFSMMAFSAAFNRGTDVVQEILSNGGKSSISKLRTELENVILLITAFVEISNWSVETNPRALRRLLNSLLLIRCINPQKNSEPNTELELLVNFGLVSLQIAFPVIYRRLSLSPGFDKWDEETALQINLLTTEPQNDSNQKQMEKWEQTLFKLCESNFYLNKEVSKYSQITESVEKRNRRRRGSD